MICGYATPEATENHAARHRPLTYTPVGTTALTASQAGFGCYRVSAGVAHHEQALRKALREGINLIDTSSNYADGASETLVGQVLKDLTESGELSREAEVVVSKVGYLQGRNYAVSLERKHQGRPFPELVEYRDGLEHCIHPDFLQDQLNRSLDRLNLETLDFYLLHNPEYYLEWAREHDLSLDAARAEYYRRIRNAFEYLEGEVAKGRIRYYGISSNTFPAVSDQADFTCVETVWNIAKSMASPHHFRLIQLPFNLMESGAALEKNQPSGHGVLEFARKKGLGVLINRPLNAFYRNRLIRLAEVPFYGRQPKDEIIHKIQLLTRSEKALWQKILPALDIQSGLRVRIKEQTAIGETLKHYWLNFGSYESWRQVRSGNLQPRIRGVMDFLEPYGSSNQEVSAWMASHRQRIEEAFEAVASVYAEEAALQVERVRRAVAAADRDWAQEGTLSQRAVRAVRSTLAVSCVLVGMRREEYVADVVEELRRPVEQKARAESWTTLREELEGVEP